MRKWYSGNTELIITCNSGCQKITVLFQSLGNSAGERGTEAEKTVFRAEEPGFRPLKMPVVPGIIVRKSQKSVFGVISFFFNKG